MLQTQLAFVSSGVAEILINSFESPADVAKVEPRNAEVSLTTEGVTSGRQALLIRFAHADWPNIYFRIEQAFSSGDWSAFGRLAVDITNPEDEPVDVCIRVDDDFSADGIQHCRTGRTKLSPKQSTTLVVPLGSAIPPGMRGGQPIMSGALTMGASGGEIDWSNITAFQIFLPRPNRERTLIVDNIRLLPMPDNNGIVDQYGQFTRADWKGKVHKPDEFQKQFTQEQTWLNTHQQPIDRDEFGGWKNRPKLRATGFFRTAYVVDGQEAKPPEDIRTSNGRWWLVTPTGRLFFSLGIDCVRHNERTSVQEREYLFSWLPDEGDRMMGFSPLGPNRWANFYGMNLLRRYGADWQHQWQEFTAKRLLAYGFNTIGNWSTPEMFRLRRIPYTVPIHYGWGELSHFPTAWRHMPDVFDERFPQLVDAAIGNAVQEWKDDRWCVGYFVDNELSWGGWGSDVASRYDLPLRVLASDATLFTKREFVRWLQAKYGDITQLNVAWQMQLESWSAMTQSLPKTSWSAMTQSLQKSLRSKKMTDACISDLSTLLTHFARRYFEVVRAVLKKHAPNQLYLGCRFAPRPMEVVQVSTEFCDVVSFNIYKKRVDEDEWAFTNMLKKPCMIGEFHFGALDRGMFHGGLVPVANQEERGKSYQEYVRSVWALPAFVGCHWFQYVDQPLTGRFDGENYNIGFVSIVDYPHWELVEAVRQINTQVYDVLGKDER